MYNELYVVFRPCYCGVEQTSEARPDSDDFLPPYLYLLTFLSYLTTRYEVRTIRNGM